MANRKRTSQPRDRTPPRPPATPPRRPGRDGPGPLSRARAAVRPFGFLLVLLAVVAVAVALGVRQGRGEGDFDSAPATATQPQEPFRSQAERLEGRPVAEVFSEACGTCHTLRAAGTQGVAGPSLDGRRLTAARVEQMILEGSVDGAMPARILQGEQAARVARYVARASRPRG
jgi:mono/diheme cytochrome c family protein